MPTKPKPPKPETTTVTDGSECQPVFQHLPVERLLPHPDNIRDEVGDVSELAKSISGVGVLEPLLVLPADPAGMHLVVAGHRRLAAALEAGLVEVPCIARALDPAAVVEAMLVENLQRCDLTPLEEARAYARLIELDTKVTDIAARVGQSRTRVTGRLNLLTLPETTLDWLADSQITLADAAALADLVSAHPDAFDVLETSGGPIRAGQVTAILDGRAKADALAAVREDLHEVGDVEFVTNSPFWYPPARFSASPTTVDRLTGVAPIEHLGEPCHQYRLIPARDDEGNWEVRRDPICAEPMRHTTLALPGNRSDLQVNPDLYAHLDPDRSQTDKAAAYRQQAQARAAETRDEAKARQAFMMGQWAAGKLPRLDPIVAQVLMSEASISGELFEIWDVIYPDVEPDHDDQIELDYAIAAQADPATIDQWAWAYLIHVSDRLVLPLLDDRLTPGDGPVLAAFAGWLRYVEHLGHQLGPHARGWLDAYTQHPIAAELPTSPTVDPVDVDVDALEMSPDLADLMLSPMVVAGEVILPTASSLAADLLARGWAEPARREGDAMTVYRFTNAGLAIAVAVGVDAAVNIGTPDPYCLASRYRRWAEKWGAA